MHITVVSWTSLFYCESPLKPHLLTVIYEY